MNADHERLHLRPPQNEAEWQRIHELRRDALFDNRLPYDPHHPDNWRPGHHVLALVSEETVVGTIRIDLGASGWAAFRLIVVAADKRGRGYGGAMLRLAEDFTRTAGYACARLHAAPAAVDFYRRNGYAETDWHEGSRDLDSVSMGKRF